MKRFKQFLNEWVEEINKKKTISLVDDIVNHNSEAQKILDELNKLEANEVNESLVSEGKGSPFGDEGGTYYDGETDEVSGNENDNTSDNNLSEDVMI